MFEEMLLLAARPMQLPFGVQAMGMGSMLRVIDGITIGPSTMGCAEACQLLGALTSYRARAKSKNAVSIDVV